MYVPQVVNQGTCIDNEYLTTAYENLDFLYDCALTNFNQFSCTPIDEEKTSTVSRTASELCFTVKSRDDTISPSIGNQIIQKMLLFNIDSSSDYSGISDSENSGIPATERETRIVVDGVTIQTLTHFQTNARILTAFFMAPANAQIDICFDSKVVISGTASFLTAIQHIQICGALVCIGDQTNAVPDDYFPLQQVDLDCCYGREAIHLLTQNATSLRNTFKEFGQVFDCREAVFNDQNNHTLINTATTKTDWLVVGSLKVCARNPSRVYAGEVVAEPSFACGDSVVECLSRSLLVPTTTGSQPRTVCVTAPVVACGTCEVGDSLTSSIRSQFVCNEANSQVVTGGQNGVFGVEQRYCLFTFERVSTDFGDELTGTMGKCLELERMQAINTSMDLMNDVCEAQEEVELVTDFQQGVGDRNDCVTIRAAQPGPVVAAKFFLVGTIFPCVSSLGGLNYEDLRTVSATAELTCGGTVVLTETVRWTLTQSGSVQRCGGAIQISQCIECDSDQDIQVCFTSARTGGQGFIRFPDEFGYTFNSFTFRG